MGETKTVKVRIAVAVDADGEWNTSGWGNLLGMTDESAAMELATETVGTGEARYWIEAEVALPSAATVQGVATASLTPGEEPRKHD